MTDTVADLIRARVGDDSPAIAFENSTWTYRQYVQASVQRAALIAQLRTEHPRERGTGFHIGVLADNIPEFPMWLGAAALAGATVVGINPTRRGAELERDIAHTSCDLIVTEKAHLPLLAGLDLPVAAGMVLDVDSPSYLELLAPHAAASLDEVDVHPGKDDLFLLIFTSGTSAAPKAVICSQGRLAMIGPIVAQMFGLTADDVCYEAMPMFHSNALMACWCPAIAAGATFAMRRKFSASGFLADVRAYGATYFNYVGKTLSYVLATPELPDDADNTLVRGFGNEGSRVDLEDFSRRFACTITDAYGSTEGGAVVSATDDTPPGALGPAGAGNIVLDPATGDECPRARFDEAGRLVNADEAIGEMVSKFGGAMFEGYWDNDEANRERLRDGMYWTGDLAYVDEAGFIYFAGRSYDWLRVDGENFAAAPVERILSRYESVTLAAVYAVPDALVGDQVMAALELKPGTGFDPEDFSAFLAKQTDLGTKWSPRYVRISQRLPVTESNKVLKRSLRSEFWECTDPVWWRPKKDGPYRLLSDGDTAAIRAEFVGRGREAVLDAS